jgi:hypothetical protein
VAATDVGSGDLLGIVLDTLNEAYEADAPAINDLIEHRVPCNERLADHPTIQVGGNPTEVGMLGVINGIVERLTGKRVASKWCDDTGKKELKGFIVYVPKDA